MEIRKWLTTKTQYRWLIATSTQTIQAQVKETMNII
jgi:hypothetical protein